MKQKISDIFDDVYVTIQKQQLILRGIELILWLSFLMFASGSSVDTSSFFVWIFMPYHITLTLVFVILIIGNIREFFKFANTHQEMYPEYPKKKLKHLWSAVLCFNKMKYIKAHPEAIHQTVKVGKKQIPKSEWISFFTLLSDSVITATSWSLMFLLPLDLYIPKEFIKAHFWLISYSVFALCTIYWFMIHATNSAYATVRTIRLNELRNMTSNQNQDNNQ